MSQDFKHELSELALITVSYNPDLDRLANQIAAIPTESLLIVVDNASERENGQRLAAMLMQRPKSLLIYNAENLGLAAAINQGACHVRKHFPSIRYLLLMDQDSIPASNAVRDLLFAYKELESANPRIGCVGPLLHDAETGLSHGFHLMRGWRWIRAHPFPGARTPVPCSNLNGSGTLLPCELFEKLGGLDEGFFIDHVDTDWAFRVLASGRELWGIPWVQFDHAMGEKSLRFWLFGWRIWPYRSPKRHYFLFRNAVRLMRKSYTPAIWKGWAILKLLLTLGVHLIADVRRWAQAKSMLAGIKTGLTETKTAK